MSSTWLVLLFASTQIKDHMSQSTVASVKAALAQNMAAAATTSNNEELKLDSITSLMTGTSSPLGQSAKALTDVLPVSQVGCCVYLVCGCGLCHVSQVGCCVYLVCGCGVCHVSQVGCCVYLVCGCGVSCLPGGLLCLPGVWLWCVMSPRWVAVFTWCVAVVCVMSPRWVAVFTWCVAVVCVMSPRWVAVFTWCMAVVCVMSPRWVAVFIWCMAVVCVMSPRWVAVFTWYMAEVCVSQMCCCDLAIVWLWCVSCVSDVLQCFSYCLAVVCAVSPRCVAVF